LSRYVEGMMDSLLLDPNIHYPAGTEVAAALHRAFGTAPAISNLDFSLPSVGYFFPSLGQNISLTPLLTNVKGLGDALSPLSTKVPSFQLLDHAIPVPSLSNFDLSNVFPNFAGLQLSNLFPSLKLPSGADQNVKITHGLDAQSRKAWVQADIQLHTAPASIFSIGPMMLQIDKPFFSATVKASADGTGRVSRTASGFIRGDWNLIIGGSPMITLAQSSLSFDENGKLHVDISPDRVVLAEALQFVQDIVSQYVSSDSGFSLLPSATGIETRFSMPIPDTVAGTSGISGLSFNFLFGLNWLPKFELYAGFGLSTPDDPFNLSVFILGGGGYLVATARYQPGSRLTCNVDMGMDASASLGIAFGPINGNVHVNLGMRFIFNSGQGDLSLGIFLIIAGEVSILSIVSANITLRLEASYANGHFTCRGTFSISIKICWCFTLSVNEEVSCGIGSGGGIAWNQPPALPWLSEGSEPPSEIYTLGQALPTQAQLDQYPINVKRYIHLVS
jgi:hypothetical protein